MSKGILAVVLLVDEGERARVCGEGHKSFGRSIGEVRVKKQRSAIFPNGSQGECWVDCVC